MAHILFLTPYYPPEVGAPQTRISETATRLAQRGHEVTVLTTLPNYPTGIVPPEYRHGRNRREVRDGVRIVRVWSYIKPNKGFLQRISSQLSFGLAAAFLGARYVGQTDIIIVESPPLFDAISGVLLARLKRCPFIFTVADMWPEAAVQMGLLRSRFLITLAEWLEWAAYRRAAAVWTVTEGLRRELIRRGLAPHRVFTISNGVDTTLFHPIPQAEARAALGWDEAFIVLFAGTIGLAPGLENLLKAAEQLNDQPSVQIVLLGNGSAKDGLIAEAARRHLHNVVFREAIAHEQLPLAIAAADVCFAGLRRLPLFKGTVPVKCYEAMGCGRPILLSADDGLAREICVADAGAAMAVEPENPSAIAAGIRYFYDHPEVRAHLGQSGRAYAEACFDRDRLTSQLESHIAELLMGQQSVRDLQPTSAIPTDTC